MDRDSQLDTQGQTLTTYQAKGRLFSAAIQPRDLPAFHALQERNQERIQLLFQAFECIESAPTLAQGYELAAAQLGKQRGFRPGRLRALFSEWRKTRDWRCLVDQAMEWKPTTAVPADFIDFLNAQVDLNGRSKAAAFKRIKAMWTRGERIPGYGTWQEHWTRTHPGRPLPRMAPPYPQGWANLYRKVDSSKFRRAAATQGLSAARKHRPQVLASRVGCYVGSHYMFDDVWHDLFVNSFAEKQAGRPLELFSHDYFSARKVRWGIRVRTEDDSGKAQGLTGRMMRMILAATYYLDGYSPRGTVNVLEHGTAAMPEELEAILYDHTGGLVTAERSGMGGKAAHAGQYDGRGIGNPNFKASLESSNNLLHNMEAHLPGQTGPDRQRRPEQLHGLLTYNARLLKAYQQLPADKARLLQFPLLELSQYMTVLSEIYQFMESDYEHELEDWITLGHTTTDVHILGEWRTQDDLLRLSDGEREMALELIRSGMVRTKPRKLSRLEVWQRGAGDLVRIKGGTVCKILGQDFASERRIRSHQFVFEDREVGPGEHRFEGAVMDDEGRMTWLKDGETYLAFINPFAPGQLFVQDAKGRYLGIAARCERASRADAAAMHAAMGRARHLETELLAPVAARQVSETRKKLTMHRNNAAVLQHTADAREAFTQQAIEALDASIPTDTDNTHDQHEHAHEAHNLW
jgi:hypothetical protein